MGSSRKPAMVFISNLRTLSDMVDLYPPSWHKRVREARNGPGFISSPPFDIAGHATGYLVLMLRSGMEVMKDQASARQKVLEMVRYAAEDLDADIIGLGSLTASVTSGGLVVADEIDRNGWRLRATHGDAGSVAAIRHCIDLAGVRADERIAIVGAYGVIGSALSLHLASDGRDLVLCGRDPRKLADIGARAAALGLAPRLESDVAGVYDADCIITVTSHPASLIDPARLRTGAVVIDPAVPANVADGPEWHDPARRLVVVNNASQVRVPRVIVTSAMFGTYDDPDGTATTYACLAETMADAVFGERSHHVGEIDPAFVREVERRFAVMGFSHALPRMFGADASAAVAARRP